MLKMPGFPAYPELLEQFSSTFYDAQTSLMNQWQHPFQHTLDSLLHFSNLTNQSFTKLADHHHETLQLFLDRGIEKSQAQTKVSTTISHRAETGRVALVTGGIGGIGSAICKQLFNDGHQVIATYISLEADKAKAWQQAYFEEGYEFDIIECDVTDFKACKKMAATIDKRYNRIDILINCAGITRDATLKKMELENWNAVLDTNLDSVFNVTRNVINKMIKRGYGRIVNISSVNGQKGQFGQTNYATAKAGMIGFTKSLALELADTGVTANSVCPGYVGTSMVEAIAEDVKNKIIAQIPVGRLAKPTEVAAAVSFLSAENSGYVTGSELSVNGGLFTG